MTRNEAAVKVGVAFKTVKVVPKKADPKKEQKPVFVAVAIKDPDAKGFTVEIDGETAVYEFKHAAKAHEQRKHEVAEFKPALVNELADRKGEPLLKPPAAEEPKPPSGAPQA